MKGNDKKRNKRCEDFALWDLFLVDNQKFQAHMRLCRSLEMKRMCLKGSERDSGF